MLGVLYDSYNISFLNKPTNIIKNLYYPFLLYFPPPFVYIPFVYKLIPHTNLSITYLFFTYMSICTHTGVRHGLTCVVYTYTPKHCMSTIRVYWYLCVGFLILALINGVLRILRKLDLVKLSYVLKKTFTKGFKGKRDLLRNLQFLIWLIKKTQAHAKHALVIHFFY